MTATAYRLERAWVDGAVRDDVLVEIEDSRFTAVTPGRESSRLDDQPSPAVGHPRPHPPWPRQLPQSRVPPGAEGPDAARNGDVLDLARADVRRGRAARPGLLLHPRPGHLPRDGRRRDHQRGGVPLPAPPARRHAVRRCQRHGTCTHRCGRRGRTADHSARHLLPQQRLRRATRGRAAALLRRHCRRVGRSSLTPAHRPRRRHPLRACRARRPARHGRGREPEPTTARAPQRADRGERRLHRGVRRDTHSAARRPRRAGPAHHGRARHPPHRRRRPPPRQHPHLRLLLPDHRTRPR